MGDSMKWAYEQEQKEREEARRNAGKRERERTLDLLLDNVIELSQNYKLMYRTRKHEYRVGLERKGKKVYIDLEKV